MHLLFLTGTPLDVRAGSGTAVGISVLERALVALGHRVTRIAPDGAPSLIGRLLFDYGLRAAARRVRPDVVVAFDWDGLFAERSGAPHIASLKGVVADERRFEHGLAKASLAIAARLERAHVARADRIISTSRYSAGRIREDYGPLHAPIEIVPEPIDLERWEAALTRAPANRDPGDAPRILCVAHLYPRKDVRTLLAAMARLTRPATLHVVGDGPEFASLRRLAASLGLGSRADFTGHVSFDALAAEYRRSEVFCLPSRQEGFGIVFLEAMAAGLPIVAARAGATPEVVRDGETGRLVAPADPAELASVLDRLLASPEERGALGEAGRRRVRRYDAAAVARDFLRAIGAAAPDVEPSPAATSP